MSFTDQVVLSLFPGIDLFGRAFESEGFCLVRGPDVLWGGDVRRFDPPAGHFSGVIGGPPCQAFSSARRSDSQAEGQELVGHFARIVVRTRPDWFLMENVPRVPSLHVDPYAVQRIDVRGGEVGLRQRRLRHFQFGSLTGRPLCLPRQVTGAEDTPAAMAAEGRRAGRRGWAEFCQLQGLDGPLALPGLTLEARYRAVGNGVPLPMGRLLARAIRHWLSDPTNRRVCACGCARPVTGRRVTAGPACRKRLERQRRGVGVSARIVTPQQSPSASRAL